MVVRSETQRELIPGYRLLEPLGRGGYGEVWKAEAPGGVLKAVKLVYGDLQGSHPDGARAAQELKALARVKTVRHPYVLSIDRYDIIDGQLVIVMELADENLEHRLRHWQKQGATGIPRAELLRYMEEAAEGLDLMNLRHDLQHLDIKPQNLFLIEHHIKVADFGLVKDLKGLAASVTGGVTPQYAAPEMFQGWVSRYTDQYSLAIVYQEMLTGQRPFRGQHIQQLILQHIQGQPDLDPLPETDRPIIARSLSKDPNGRFPSCLDLVRALQMASPSSAETLPNEGAATDARRPARAEPTTTSMVSAAASPSATFAPTTSVRPEERGDGVLCPALVIGLGRMGSAILQLLRRQLHARFGDLHAVPHIGFLYLDSDPESVERFLAEPSGSMPTPDEVLLCRLQRVGHYLRQRDLMPPVQEWLDPAMLYRLSRDGTTNGIRALGRLALLSNYRTIVNRLLRELSRIMDRVTLASAAKYTGLALRSNWPRVYVATSLWGGSGSGMFLDLAYLIRSVLRELSVGRQEIVGFLALPPSDDAADHALGAANSHAALRELCHYSTPGECFRARYEAKAPVVEEVIAPFARCMLFGGPGRGGQRFFDELITLAAGALERELLTPLADALQGPGPNPHALALASSGRPLSCFGWQALASPRRMVIRGAARRLVGALVEQWGRKGVAPQRAESLGADVDDWLAEAGLELETLGETVQRQSAERLTESYQSAFARCLDPIRTVTPPAWPEPAAFKGVVQQIEAVLGSPHDGLNSLRPAPAAAQIRDVALALADSAVQGLAEFIIAIVDQPGDRLGTAEEVARLAGLRVEQWLRECEDTVQALASRLDQTLGAIRSGLAEWERVQAQGSGKRGDTVRGRLVRELAEQFAAYPELLLKHLIHQRLLGVYLGLRGHLSDQIRELGYFRQPLAALGGKLPVPESERATPGRLDDARCRPLLPSNCAGIEQRVGQVIDVLGSDVLDRFDDVIETAIRKELGGLAEICRAPGQRALETLQALLVREAEAFVNLRLPRDDAAECFFGRRLDESELVDEIQTAFDDAIPPLAEHRLGHQSEMCVLVVPRSEAGRRFAALALRVIPGLRTIEMDAGEELLFYRELQGITISDLPHGGSIGRAAYDRACALEQFTPHSRTDLSRWRELPK